MSLTDQPQATRAADIRDWVAADSPHAEARVFAGSSLALDMVTLQPEATTGVRTFADADVCYVVLGGRAWCATESGDIGLDAMGSLFVPAGQTHGIRNEGVDPLVMAVATSHPGATPQSPPVEERGQALRDDAAATGLLARIGRARKAER